MALVPLSVSMSMKTSRVRSRNVLYPPSAMAFSRSLAGARRAFWTMRTLCISIGMDVPFESLTLTSKLFTDSIIWYDGASIAKSGPPSRMPEGTMNPR